MSSSEFKTTVTIPSTISPSSTPTSSDANSVPQSTTPESQLERQMLIEDEKPEQEDEGTEFVSDAPDQTSQTESLPSDIELPPEYSSAPFSYICGNSRQGNLFLFTSDGNFASLSPHHMLDLKDLDKGDSSGVILSGRPLSSSSLSAGSNASPKPFMALHLNETKNDKMISGFDGRVDGLSPLSVIAVSAYQDAGHASPNMHSGLLSRSHPVLKYQPGGDAMLSALNYGESDMLQEGGFDVPSSSSFGSLDGLLGTSIGGGSASGMRLPDLLDGEISQEAYIDAGQDLQLSPQTFSAGESFTVSESTSLGSLNDGNDVLSLAAARETSKIVENSSVLVVEKLKVKGGRPVKATSPSRPGTQPCPTCGKVFSNSSALTKHKLTHSDERKYVCALCAKAFKRQDHLNGHMLTHRNKKPFECNAEGCGKSYCDARSLRRHKENHHSTPSTQPTTAAPIAVSALGKQVTVIPGLAHLTNFSSLQSSFPASVITSNSNPTSTESALGNRIQYAPPPATTLPAHTSVISHENTTRPGEGSLVGSIIPANGSQLQFLAFQQSPPSSQSAVTSTTVTSKSDRTVLASWPSQTINTGALLLAQNLDASQHRPKPAQVITGTFSISSDQGKTNASQIQTSTGLLSEVVKKALATDNSREQSPIERPCSKSEYADKLGEKSILVSANETSADRISPLNVCKQPDSVDDSSFTSTVNVSFAQKSTSDAESGGGSSVPTTPTAGEHTECLQMESPLLQQLLNQHNTELGNRIAQNFPELSFLPDLSEQQRVSSQPSNSVQQSQTLIPQWSQVRYTVPNSVGTNRHSSNQDPKPVECSLCQRKFKNTPALNGHMRLHGGYFKKEHEAKKNEKKASSTASQPTLTTASTNVRALIEEKIIQKRNSGSQVVTPTTTTITTAVVENASSPPVKQVFQFQETVASNTEPSSPFVAQTSSVLSPVVQETSVFDEFPITSQSDSVYDSISAQSSNALTFDWLKKLDLKQQQFRVPRPPGEKHRRHSDSDHFIPAKRPCTSYTNSVLADLLRRKVVAKRTTRTGSDPGEPLMMDILPFSEIPDSSLPLDFLPKFTSTISSSLHNSHITDSDLNQDDITDPTGEESTLPILSAEDIPDAQPAMVGLKDVPEIDPQCLVKNVFFDTSNPSIPIGQPFPDISVSELEMMHLTTTVSSAATMPFDMEPADSEKIHMGEDSNDDDVFLSPTSLPTSPIKTKRKHRPEPLYIPPYVNTCGFNSRLRSPRLWDPLHPDHKKFSPPPYTPPPMLSPVRSGSGLFWHIISGSGSLTPKSAPITPSFGYPRKGSSGDITMEEEENLCEAPESDILPHVNIGSYYQAKLPSFNPHFKDALFSEHKADKVWDPSSADQLSDEAIDAYLEFSCSAAIPGGGRNKEYAFHLLHLCRGNIKDAVLSLMDSSPELPRNHALLNYKYPETDKWSSEEIDAYHQGLMKCDKDFFSIAKDIPTKSVKQCIQFYYVWKKVCPDEYKRIRLIRRRKEQESLYYNLRSKEEEEENNRNQTQSSDVDQGNCSEDTSDHDILMNGQVSEKRVIFSKTASQDSAVSSFNGINAMPSTSVYEFPLEPLEEFPCKICGKIFSKVKSRSAHMKSHRQQDEKRGKCGS